MGEFGEGGPTITDISSMSDVLRRLELQQERPFTDLVQPEKVATAETLDDVRIRFYDQMNHAAVAGLTHDEASSASEVQWREYRKAQADAMADWVRNNPQLIKTGAAQLARFTGAHPNLSHPDYNLVPTYSIQSLTPALINSIVGKDYDGVARPLQDRTATILSQLGRAAFAGLTSHKSEADEVARLYLEMVDVTGEIFGGIWHGTHDLNGRSRMELAARGIDYIDVSKHTDGLLVATVPRVGFTPKKEYPSQPNAPYSRTIGEPHLKPQVIFHTPPSTPS